MVGPCSRHLRSPRSVLNGAPSRGATEASASLRLRVNDEHAQLHLGTPTPFDGLGYATPITIGRLYDPSTTIAPNEP